MLRKPAFWLVLGVISATAALYALRNFSVAFPLVSVDIRMDRRAALDSARSLATRYNWSPATFDQAASFGVDQEVQNFIELEGGGKEALRRIIAEHTFAPYTWMVRNYKEGDTHEAGVRFTPEGDPFGFALRIPENEEGVALDADAARAIAERAATADWRVDFSKYLPAESSEEIRPGGRKDHAFVYERQDIRIGEGRYRLRLTVSGDKFTELNYFIQVPEAFTRRYVEMRAANDAISTFATVAVAVYLLGFCGAGLFFMMRQRWLLWRPALGAAIIIAGVVGLGEAFQWPLVWMNYDTALPAGGFALRQIALIVGSFLAYTVVFAITFMAAETLSRRAFPNHIQFWRIWSMPAASSLQVLGRTLAGYLTVSLAIFYIIVFYGFTQQRFGWWSPSDTLIDPNIFASYLPSFSAVSLAAQAGFWEECLFRAVPLSVFALIGNRFGRRRGFLIAGFIIQALVFGSGHAGYANQPSYARVVELIVPSSIFAGYFLAFGLLPGIVMHFSFDAVLMSLPIFAASTLRAHVEALLVILLMLIPLWVVLIARMRMGRWVDLAEEYRNRAWTPPPAEEPAVHEPITVGQRTISPSVRRVLPVAALAGLIVWIFASHFRSDAPGIAILRPTAESVGHQALSDRGVQLDPSWTVLSRVSAQSAEADGFVWQKAGRTVYEILLGSYLPPPHWVVRFARFTGDVAERAEEYQVAIAGDGHVYRVRHELPEARPGPALTEQQAKSLALSTIEQDFRTDANDANVMSAEVKKRPARSDWSVEFKDNRNYGLPEGEPRLQVEITGDGIADANRYVHVPEEWERNERSRRNLPDILSVAMTALTLGIVLAGAIVAAIRWSRGYGFSIRALRWTGGVILLFDLINIPNNWKATISTLSTAQPYAVQVGMLLAIGFVSAAVTAGALALAAGYVADAQARTTGTDHYWLTGVSLGLIFAGARTLAAAFVPSLAPAWADYSAAGASLPVLAAALAPFTPFVVQALLLSLIFEAVDQRTRRWAFRRVSGVLLLFVSGLLLSSRSIESIPSWLAGGALVGATLVAMYVFVIRHQPGVILPAVATLAALSTLREALHRAYPGALTGGVLAVAIIASFVLLTRNNGRAVSV